MPHLSKEAKEAIVLKALNRDENQTIKAFAQANNVGKSSLQKWMQDYRENNAMSENSDTLSTQARLNHVIATASLDDEALGTYCRGYGLYSFQIHEWKAAFMKQSHTKNNEQESALKKLKAENKALQQELRHKEKALAEASALLVLKKKADLIWGENEDA